MVLPTGVAKSLQLSDVSLTLLLLPSASGADGQVLAKSGSALVWTTLAGGGDMLAANNLSEVNPALARANLDVEPGVDVQAWDADLDAIAALATHPFGRGLLPLTSGAAVRTYIGAGTSSFDGAWSSLSGTPTTLAGYGITDAQSLSNELTAIAALADTAGLIRKTGDGSYVVDAAVYLTGVSWGAITGTLSSQADLQAALDAKAAASHSHAQADVTNLVSDLAAKAPLASPVFTGVPTAPTAGGGTNTTQIATTAFVAAAISGISGGLGVPADVNCSANPDYPAATAGDNLHVTVAGRIGGASGPQVDVGDWIICKVTNGGGSHASVGANWYIVEHNLVGALLAGNNLSDLSDASAARLNLGVDAAGTDNSTNVTIAAGLDYVTISGQELTLGSVDLSTDVTGSLPQASVTGLVAGLAAKAPLASPALTGNPTAPTQSASDNSTKIATTAYVDAAVIGGGGGNVSKVGTPVDNQVGVWTGDGTIEGDANLTYDGSSLTVDDSGGTYQTHIEGRYAYVGTTTASPTAGLQLSTDTGGKSANIKYNGTNGIVAIHGGSSGTYGCVQMFGASYANATLADTVRFITNGTQRGLIHADGAWELAGDTEVRDGATALDLGVFKTYTSDTVFERIVLDTTSDAAANRIGSERGSAGGVLRPLQIGVHDGSSWTTAIAVDAGADLTLPVAAGQDVGTPAASDLVLLCDASDGNKLKVAQASTLGGGGGGTVTSVAVSGSDGIEVDSGSPVTSSGTIALGVNAATMRSHLGLNNRKLVVTMGDGVNVIAAGAKAMVQVPRDATIVSWEVAEIDEVSGSISFDIWRDTTLFPAVGDSITGTTKPNLSSQTNNSGSDMTGWTTALNADDWLTIVAESSPASVKRVVLIVDIS